MKIFYFDTETTGVDPDKHEITQLSAIVEIDGEVKEEVNWRCQPTDWENIDPVALEVTGISLEELKKQPLPSEMMGNLRKLFDKYIDKYDKEDKFFPAGHNVRFDLEFLQSFWKRHGDEYGSGSYQNWRALDSMILANFFCAIGKMNVPNVKLETLCDFYEIKIKAHDALSDIRATRELILKMMKELK